MQFLQSDVEIGPRSAFEFPNRHPHAVLHSARSSDSAPTSTKGVGGWSVDDKEIRRTAPVLAASALSCATFAAATALMAESFAIWRISILKEAGTVRGKPSHTGAVRGVAGAAPPTKKEEAGVAGAAQQNTQEEAEEVERVEELVAICAASAAGPAMASAM